MPRFTELACALGLMALLQSPAMGADDDANVATLVSRLQDRSDTAASTSAFLALRKAMYVMPSEGRGPLQASLCESLRVSNDAWAIRRIALVLSAGPCDDAVLVLAQRLEPGLPQALGAAICDGMHAFADNRPVLTPATTALALERLEVAARYRLSPGSVVDSAIMAMATFGREGFDRLMELQQDANAPKKIRNVFYAAVAETDDPRALAVLREAADDPWNSEGRRIQAIYGLGQWFSRAATASRPIDSAELAACLSLMQRFLDETTPDRVFAAALKAAGRMVSQDQDSDLQQAVVGALFSASDIRREAALDALFQQNGSLIPVLSARVHGIAQSDGNPDLRCSATAVLEKQAALQTTSSPDGA